MPRSTWRWTRRCWRPQHNTANRCCDCTAGRDPPASFGYFQKYADVEPATSLRPLIRRPTGGGIVPHDADWTYSLAFPPGHDWHGLAAVESYQRVHAGISTRF